MEQIVNIDNYINSYVTLDEQTISEIAPVMGERMEGRTRDNDITEALRFRVHDPLWMLTRQWQLGEFRGNNVGTAMAVKCQVYQDDCQKDPIEPVTERINPQIDLLVRVESAVYLLDLIRQYAKCNAATFKSFAAFVAKKNVIKWEEENQVLDSNLTTEHERGLNKRRGKFINAYKGKTFDGYALYVAFYNYLNTKKKDNNHIFTQAKNQKIDLQVSTSNIEKIMKTYTEWFQKKYIPGAAQNTCWQERDLCYEVKVAAGSSDYVGERYEGGRISWHTFDYKGTTKQQTTAPQNILSLPTLATYSGAPNKRLWEFEDRKVFMGNSVEQQSDANLVFMKFATMYGNDWMLIPLQTEIGKSISISQIEVKDTFGDTIIIKGTDRAGANDTEGDLQENWQVFTNSLQGTQDGSSANNLFFAPQLATTLEGTPIEEVEMLRDEMANMVWGVETLVSDGCGGAFDGNLYATELADYVNELYDEYRVKPVPKTFAFGQDGEVETKTEEGMERAAYKYVLQSTVPYNWIPFVPQHKGGTGDIFSLGGREMILRRGKMACYVWDVNNKQQLELMRKAVRPLTSILRKGISRQSKDKWRESPLLINEEAVQATGIKLVKNYQRTRWLNGRTYNWLGIYKVLAKTKGSSGLEFDVLKENK